MSDMSNTIDDILDSVNTFLTDIQEGLAVVGAIDGVEGLIGGISGGITSALSFENITLDIFGCDLKPNSASSDFYTLQNGSGAAEEAQQPRPGDVNKATQNPTPIRPEEQTPFATPRKDTPDYDYRVDASSLEQVQQRTGDIA
jgi:hypothetical protein